MDVLLIIGISVGGLITIYSVYAYNNYVEEKTGNSIFSIGKILLFTLAEGCVFYALLEQDRLKPDNFIVLLILAGVIAVGCLITNIISFGPFHGFFSTVIQSATAALILILLLFIMGAAGSKKKRKARSI